MREEGQALRDPLIAAVLHFAEQHGKENLYDCTANQRANADGESVSDHRAGVVALKKSNDMGNAHPFMSPELTPEIHLLKAGEHTEHGYITENGQKSHRAQGKQDQPFVPLDICPQFFSSCSANLSNRFASFG